MRNCWRYVRTVGDNFPDTPMVRNPVGPPQYEQSVDTREVYEASKVVSGVPEVTPTAPVVVQASEVGSPRHYSRENAVNTIHVSLVRPAVGIPSAHIAEL